MAVIKRFWIVTMPEARSTVSDICFEINWLGLENQFRGGLKADKIRAVYDNKGEAKEYAERLIRWRKNEPGPTK